MISVLIVDDEPLARQELRRLFCRYSSIGEVNEAQDGIEALELINQKHFDMVFVDIRMPGMDGIELASSIGNTSLFVFCTAYSQHALEAFDLNAFDYLLKPVNPNRLDQVIAKAELALANQSYHGVADNKVEKSILAENHGFLLKFGHDYKIIRLDEVQRFEAVGNHVAVHLDGAKSFIQSSLSRLESRLNESVFFKASRSDVVKIDAIVSIEDGMAAGTLELTLKNGQQLTISRRQAQNLKKIFSL